MKILAVDDEMIALKNLELVMLECGIKDGVHYETSPIKALKWLKDNKIEVALLDINMRQMSGLLMAKQIKENYPNCKIIFITGYAEYAVQAFALKASGYLLKPVEVNDLMRELDYVQVKTQRKIEHKHNIFIQCFGNFEVFIDDKIVNFTRKKSKELLAYLIDRKGANVSMADIACILWEDGVYNISRNNQIHTYLHDLIKTFNSVGEKDIIIKKRNAIAVDINKLDCDAYECNEDPASINAYHGEYMCQYSWAEFSVGAFIQ